MGSVGFYVGLILTGNVERGALTYPQGAGNQKAPRFAKCSWGQQPPRLPGRAKLEWVLVSYWPSPGTLKFPPRSSLTLVVAGMSSSESGIFCVRSVEKLNSVLPTMA